jgi:ABC-2 type transport system permease protein
MLSALLYLRLTSLRNWFLSRIRRLRQPKYLAGAIVGAAYFWFFFFRPLTSGPASARRSAASREALEAASAVLPTDWAPATAALGALVLLIFLALMWIVPTGPAALGFTEAEIAFLFPAPITRRGLVHFRLLSAQFRSLVGATIMMLFSNNWTAVGGNAFTHAIGWWFIFSALNLHYSGAGFVLTRMTEHGVGTWRRRLLVGGVVIAIIGAAVARLPAAGRLPAIGDELTLSTVATWAVNVTNTAPLSWLLWPLKLVLGPFLASDARSFLGALPPALAVITLHYLWVVRAAVRFEDATIDHAQKRATRAAAWRRGDRRMGGGQTKGRAGPFPLRSSGRPEFAFLWKNLLSTWPYFTPRVFAIAAFVITATCYWLNSQPYWRPLLPGIGFVTLMFAGYTLIVGPQFARQDIRTDLPNTDILKTYPLAGWQIVFGELLAPAAILTGVLWLALLIIALTFHPSGTRVAWLTLDIRIAGALTLATLTPLVVALQLLVPNAAALLFPGWFQASRGRGGGPEVVGQRMIFFFAQMFAMLLALLPAAVLAAALILIFVQLLGVWPAAAILLSAVPVLLVLVGEVWCGLWWLGQRFEKLDLSSELRP